MRVIEVFKSAKAWFRNTDPATCRQPVSAKTLNTATTKALKTLHNVGPMTCTDLCVMVDEERQNLSSILTQLRNRGLLINLEETQAPVLKAGKLQLVWKITEKGKAKLGY